VGEAGNGVAVSANWARKGKPWIPTSTYLRATAPILDPTIMQTILDGGKMNLKARILIFLFMLTIFGQTILNAQSSIAPAKGATGKKAQEAHSLLINVKFFTTVNCILTIDGVIQEGYIERGHPKDISLAKGTHKLTAMPSLTSLDKWESNIDLEKNTEIMIDLESIQKKRWEKQENEEIEKWVAKLNDPDPDVREKAANRKVSRGYTLYEMMIKKGDRRYVSMLIIILKEFGDTEMAKQFLNCGNSELESAAREWATSHGYEIETRKDNGSSQSMWGRD
jgi:hypothetical protein